MCVCFYLFLSNTENDLNTGSVEILPGIERRNSRADCVFAAVFGVGSATEKSTHDALRTEPVLAFIFS